MDKYQVGQRVKVKVKGCQVWYNVEITHINSAQDKDGSPLIDVKDNDGNEFCLYAAELDKYQEEFEAEQKRKENRRFRLFYARDEKTSHSVSKSELVALIEEIAQEWGDYFNPELVEILEVVEFDLDLSIQRVAKVELNIK